MESHSGHRQVSPVSRMTGNGTSFEKNCSVRHRGLEPVLGGKMGFEVGPY